MRHWFKDQHFRSLLKNSGYLAVSKAIAAVAGVATFAFAGRGLGVLMFGMLILIHSYAQAASSLSKFQSWQLVIRYGGHVLVSDDANDFKEATGFALGLDISSGLIGMVLAMLLLPLVGHWFGIPDRYLTLAILYCTVLPTMGAATPSGVLRSLDRFDLISWQGTTYPIARAILAGAAWSAKAPFEAYVFIWYITDLGGDLYLWFLAWRELRRRKLHGGIRPKLRPAGLPGAWRFAIHVNLAGSLTAAWGSIGRLIVGGLLGPAGAAIYRVAASLADSAQKPSDLLGRAIYPEIVRMDLSTKRPWKLMLRGAALASAAALVAIFLLLLGGRPLIEFIFGAKFGPAYPVLMVLVIVPLISILSFPMAPMLYALDRPDAPLTARVIGVVIYFITIAPLAHRFGVAGAAAAYVIGYAVMFVWLAFQVGKEYRARRTARPSPA